MDADHLATDQAWQEFLKTVERKALRMATIATGSQEDALDIVQDSMLGLVRKYRHKRVDEMTPLFYRILQSRIRDWYRRQAVRRRWQVWVRADADDDPYSGDLCDRVPDPAAKNPAEHLARTDAMRVLESALRQLPLRQQQTFLLRAWEGLSVAETALAMRCSEGSVKTHYSRALNTLRKTLEDHWP